MSKEGKGEVKAAIITGVCALLVGILGTFFATSAINNNQVLTVFFNGTEVRVSPDENQAMIDDLREENNSLKAEKESFSQKAEEEYSKGFEAGKLSISLPAEPHTESAEIAASANGVYLFSDAITQVDSKRWAVGAGQVADPLGNTHDTKYYAHAREDYFYGWDTGWAEYNINQKYTQLSGTVVSHVDIATGAEAVLTIFADGATIYTSPSITRTTYPFELDKKIPEGTKILKIEVSGGPLLLLDFTLS